MNKVNVLFAALLCWAVTGLAQDASITGTVTGGGEPIQGARVSVKNQPHLVAYTDASGAFSLSGAVPVINGKRAGSLSVPSVVKGMLSFATEKNSGKVCVDLFSLRGGRIFSRELTNLAPGNHAIPLMKTAQGVYIVRFTSSTGLFVMKMTNGTGSSAVKRRDVYLSSSPGKASADIIDTLVVTAPMWRHAIVDLSAYQGQANVTLTASNPWKPTGPLEHENGMVKIMAKGYDFEMGQPDPNIDSITMTLYEQPVNTVQFTYDFWMDTTEVTQKSFDSIMGMTYDNYFSPANWDPWFGLGDSFPAYDIYWGNAALYCNARSKLEGLDSVYSYDSLNAPPGELLEFFGEKCDLSKNGYRLPTDAEWEYAYRGGTATDFFWGKDYGPYPATVADSTEMHRYSVWWGNSFRFGDGQPGSGNHPSGSTKPNAYGLYEMAGNVTEFCHDYWTDNFDRGNDWGTIVDPTGPITGTWRGHVFRGANWGSNARSLRSAYRKPGFDQPDYTIFFVGFRVARPIR
jgi:formylglycine-generating enzyme required for sulfatase activity